MAYWTAYNVTTIGFYVTRKQQNPWISVKKYKSPLSGRASWRSVFVIFFPPPPRPDDPTTRRPDDPWRCALPASLRSSGLRQTPWMGLSFRGAQVLSSTAVVPFLTPFLGEGSPTKIDYRKRNGTLILTSLLEDLAGVDSDSILFNHRPFQNRIRSLPGFPEVF